MKLNLSYGVGRRDLKRFECTLESFQVDHATVATINAGGGAARPPGK